MSDIVKSFQATDIPQLGGEGDTFDIGGYAALEWWDYEAERQTIGIFISDPLCVFDAIVKVHQYVIDEILDAALKDDNERAIEAEKIIEFKKSRGKEMQAEGYGELNVKPYTRLDSYKGFGLAPVLIMTSEVYEVIERFKPIDNDSNIYVMNDRSNFSYITPKEEAYDALS